MMRFRRPPRFARDEFETRVGGDDGVREKLRQAVEDQHRQPSFKQKVWSDFKHHFLRAQEQKCGYCEAVITDRYEGDVEHYRPKSRIDRLEVDKNKRRQKAVRSTGYWWLAYDWSNYLAACHHCNKSKITYFPLRGKDRRDGALPRGAEKGETPLLLNPFRRSNPTKHLEFRPTGFAYPHKRSAWGRATIDICRLNRRSYPDLPLKRRSKADHTIELCESLELAIREKQPKAQILMDIYRKGAAPEPHAGVTRTLFEQRSQLTWSELVDMVADLQIDRLEAAASERSLQRALWELHKMGLDRRLHHRQVRKKLAARTGHDWRWLVGELVSRLASQLEEQLANEPEDAPETASLLRELDDDQESLAGVVPRAFKASSDRTWTWLLAKAVEVEL